MTSPGADIRFPCRRNAARVGHGANDGSTILGLSLPIRLPALIPALFILVAAIALNPLVVGMQVGSTLLMVWSGSSTRHDRWP
jgi:hypothetical protein